MKCYEITHGMLSRLIVIDLLMYHHPRHVTSSSNEIERLGLAEMAARLVPVQREFDMVSSLLSLDFT